MTVSCERIANESYTDFVARYLDLYQLSFVTAAALAKKFPKYKKLTTNKIAWILNNLGWIRVSIYINQAYCIYVRDRNALEMSCL